MSRYFCLRSLPASTANTSLDHSPDHEKKIKIQEKTKALFKKREIKTFVENLIVFMHKCDSANSALH